MTGDSARSGPSGPSGPSGRHAEGPARVGLWWDIARLMAEFWRAHPVAWVLSLLHRLAGNSRMGLYVLATGGLVDSLTGAGDRSIGGAHPPLFWLLVYVGASVVEEVYWLLAPLLNTYLLDQGTFRIQRRVLERAAAAPLIQFEEGEFFDHLQRANSGMGERLPELYYQVTGLLQGLIGLGSVAVALGVVHPALPLLVAGGSLPSIWFQARVATLQYEVERAHTTRDRMRTHLRRLLTDREAAPEVRLFGSGPYLLGRWRRLREEFSRDALAAERRRALFITVGSVTAGIAYAAGLVLVAALILRGQLSVGGYVAVSAGALWLQDILGDVARSLQSMHTHSRFLGDLFDFMRLARTEPTGGWMTPGDAPGAGLAAAASRRSGANGAAGAGRSMLVEAEGLTFTYPGAAHPVVRDVTLRIEPGERIAIVGENGAGKTTLVKLLMGLYQPDGGTVRLDREALTPERAAGARRRVAAVFQDYASFQLTARENVGFGDLARMRDDAAIDEAAERAGIADFLRALPATNGTHGGYDAYLGRQFGETELSGGQWQRVALARAFFREADLLVLDEPSSALDPLAELALFERFAALTEGRTAIMISHRLGAARLADRVLVLRDGRVVEDGHHDTLVASGGDYARLFAAQAQWYR